NSIGSWFWSLFLTKNSREDAPPTSEIPRGASRDPRPPSSEAGRSSPSEGSPAPSASDVVASSASSLSRRSRADSHAHVSILQPPLLQASGVPQSANEGTRDPRSRPSK